MSILRQQKKKERENRIICRGHEEPVSQADPTYFFPDSSNTFSLKVLDEAILKFFTNFLPRQS